MEILLCNLFVQEAHMKLKLKDALKDALKEVKKELEKVPEPKIKQIPVGFCTKVINKIMGK